MRRSIAWLTFLFAGIAFAPTSSAATLASPVTWGSPDQPWAERRAITAADRAAIEVYRSGRATPIFSTDFSRQPELDADWSLVSDDSASLKSCRRPESVEASPAGLRLKTLVNPTCRMAHWSSGHVVSKAEYGYGFFEARMKIADIKGVDNAFWLTTSDHFEIDVTETSYPSYMHLGLQSWPASKTEKHAGVGWGANFVENLAYSFHDVGLLWTPTDMVYEVDGDPIAAAQVNGAVHGPAAVHLSTALAEWAGGKLPEHAEGHGMAVRSLRIFSLNSGAPLR